MALRSLLPSRRRKASERTIGNDAPTSTDPHEVPLNNNNNTNNEKHAEAEAEHTPIKILRLRIIAMAAIVSLGGLIFGFDTGQISGFVAMPDFLGRFADQPGPSFSDVREGTIVGLLSIGTLVGSICAGPLADFAGRRLSIVFWDVIFIVGVIIQITTSYSWVQIAIGRLVAGFGVGGLSVLTPMYQSETAPRQIRGALICTYQLFITFGIFLAYCINYGTYQINNASSWRITMGIGFIFPALMAAGIMLLPESPRWDYRKGNVDRATRTIALSYGVSETHREVKREVREIRQKLEEETAGGKRPWHDVFTGPRMMYRTLLGITLQALQQLTGANFFFYYGTSVFQSVGLKDPFVTSMILGGVNFGCTFLGLYVVENFGRRKSLIIGALGMFVCFMIFASVGYIRLYPDNAAGLDTKPAGDAMIVFACFFILFYATTWGPIIWALVAEIYPSRYRARAMGFATSSNWTWNFLISFFTPFITNKINYAYGYVFAGCVFAGAVIVYFFVCESQGRTLEEIDTMYVMKVKPWKSSQWVAPQGDDVVEGDGKGGYAGQDGLAGDERRESVV